MGKHMKVILNKDSYVDMVLWNGRMIKYMKENLKMIKEMDLELIFGVEESM